MPKFNSHQDVYQHIRDTTGCSRTKAARAARRCVHDPHLCQQLLGVDPSQLDYSDRTGESATNHVMTGAAA